MARCVEVCLIICFGVMVSAGILLSVGLTLSNFIELIVYKGKQTHRENHFFQIQSVQTTLITPSSFPNISAVDFNFTFGVNRVVKYGALDYTFDYVSLMYKKKLISNGTFVPFTQQENEKNSTAEARFVGQVDDEIVAEIWGTGGIEVGVKLEGMLKVRRNYWPEKYGAIRVNCKKVKIRFTWNTTAALLKHSEHCKTKYDYDDYDD